MVPPRRDPQRPSRRRCPRPCPAAQSYHAQLDWAWALDELAASQLADLATRGLLLLSGPGLWLWEPAHWAMVRPGGRAGGLGGVKAVMCVKWRRLPWEQAAQR